MSTASQAQALLDLVAAWRDQECSRVAEAATQEAHRLRQEALVAARQQVHAAIEAARHQEAHAQQMRQAEQAQQKRQRRQQEECRQLAAGMDLLRRDLLARWQHQPARAQWLQMARQQAAAILFHQHWQVEHPAAWAEDEQAAFARAIEAEGQGSPRFIPCQELAGGVRICAGGACLDATVEGLLRDRGAIEAQLMALLQETGNE
jgi:hypothetical protein